MRSLCFLALPLFLPWALAAEPAAGDKVDFKVPSHANDLLDFYCSECHDSGTQKGDVRLDNFEDLGLGIN